jgi:hypothetical protein
VSGQIIEGHLRFGIQIGYFASRAGPIYATDVVLAEDGSRMAGRFGVDPEGNEQFHWRVAWLPIDTPPFISPSQRSASYPTRRKLHADADHRGVRRRRVHSG